MGAQPSRIPEDAALEEELLSGLGRLRVNSIGSDYTYVDDDALEIGGGTTESLKRDSCDVATEVMVSWQHELLKDPKNKLALSAMRTADPRVVLASPATPLSAPRIFNVRIPFDGGPTAPQRVPSHGWSFAATNIFRIALMRRHGLSSFELSQSYLFFWDKVEKANWFLEQVIETAAAPHYDLDSRLVQALLGDIVSDAGQWDMAYNLVRKYGLVPQALYPDSWSARDPSVLNSALRTRLREAALSLRAIVARGCESTTMAREISAAKEETMREVLLILTLTLGKPPPPDDAFTWTFLDKDGSAHELTSTPRAFASNIYSPAPRITSATIASMVSLVHDPRHEPLTLLTISRLGNVVGGRGVIHINVAMETLKGACVAMLRAGLPVFFGCDMGKFTCTGSGVMDLDVVDYQTGFNVSLLGPGKADRMRTGGSRMTHAMVLTGVHVESRTGRTARWRVQGSGGEAAGGSGSLVMSDRWMDEFVYQAVVDPRFLGREVRDVLGTKPTVLPLWDPMGSLA